MLRQTMRTRWQAKLRAVKTELRRRLHHPFRSRAPICARSSSGTTGTTVSRERPGAERLPVRRWPSSGGACCAPQPRQPLTWSRMGALRRPLASDPAHLSSLSARALRRHHPRQEPDAVIPHVRICGGGDQRWSFLLRLVWSAVHRGARWRRCRPPSGQRRRESRCRALP